MLDAIKKLREERDDLVGKWLSAALEDHTVSEEMKEDIREWFFLGPLLNGITVTPFKAEPELTAMVRKGLK